MHDLTIRGREAELLVARYLIDLGYKILAYNYAKKNGEIDLIACTHDVLAFVEVKMRTSPLFDSTEVITRAKQKKIMAVAQEYLLHHNHEEKNCRFDVAIIEGSLKKPSITYLEDAFCQQGW